MLPEPESFANFKAPYFLCESVLRAPWRTWGDIWPKRHVYFVRHLRLCDIAKKELIRRKILRIGCYFVQKAWADYRSPMQWHEKLRIRIYLAGLLKNGKVPLLKYELHSFHRNLVLAEIFLLYFPPLSDRQEIDKLFFEERFKNELLASLEPSRSAH